MLRFKRGYAAMLGLTHSDKPTPCPCRGEPVAPPVRGTPERSAPSGARLRKGAIVPSDEWNLYASSVRTHALILRKINRSLRRSVHDRS
jgi:hypothetical protein